jgi:hypothetical protein
MLRTVSRALAVCFAAGLWATAVEARTVSGVTLPESVSIAGRELRLNGMGLSKQKIFFKVYVIGLYLERPTRNAQEAITTDEAKRIVIVMLRDVSRDAFVKAVETGIRRNSGPEMPALRERLDRLERALPKLKKGNVIEFTYLPGRGTLLGGQSEEMTIAGKDFANALFSVWLGPNPANRSLKGKLLGR